MSWTAPSTWVAGAVLTAAQLNVQLRDNLSAIGTGAAYTPTWTNVTLGTTGLVNTAKYSEAGKWITVTFELILGTGGDVTGVVSMSLPKTAAAATVIALGTFSAIDASTSSRRGGWVVRNDADTARFTIENAGSSPSLNVTVPWDWTASDGIAGTFTYLAA